MDLRPTRQIADRDLRYLSTVDLLSLIQEDIRELDLLIRAKRRHLLERKPARYRASSAHSAPAGEPVAGGPVAGGAVHEEELTELVAPPLFRVTCCNHAMGAFPASARVRCPFCGTWHRAGDFPGSA